MSEPRTLDPKDQYGQVGETWGNVLLPPGALAVGDEIRFSDDAAGTPPRKVKRVNVSPLDPEKQLYYYESTVR